MEALDILKKYWGHTSFRLNQKEVIDSIINKQDTLAPVTNAYNRENIFYFNRVKYERVNQLPLMPSIGMSLTF